MIFSNTIRDKNIYHLKIHLEGAFATVGEFGGGVGDTRRKL